MRVLAVALAIPIASGAAPPAPPAKTALRLVPTLNATVEASRLDRIAASLTKVVSRPHAPQGAAEVLGDVVHAAQAVRRATNQDVMRMLVRNATSEVLALQARLNARFKTLKAEEKMDTLAKSKPAAVQKLEGIQKSLQKLTAKGGFEDGQAVLENVNKALVAVKAAESSSQVKEIMRHMMSELHAFQVTLEAKVAEARKKADAAPDKTQVLFDALYDIQDLPLEDQLAVVQKPEYKDLPEVQKLLDSKPNGDEPLAIAFGRILDEAREKKKKSGLKHKGHQESTARIEHDILQHSNLTKEKATVLAPIVRELEGRLDRVEEKRSALDKAEKQMEKHSDMLASAADRHKSEGNEAAAKKAAGISKYLKKKTAREFKKKRASLDAEAKALTDAIAAIKVGKVNELQAAMKRLGDMKGNKQEFLH